MRLIQVAKVLGMTGQELRKELTEVDFGVRPTDREISDSLAQGIVRFVARKYGKKVDIETLGMTENAGAPAPASSGPEQEGATADKKGEREKKEEQERPLRVAKGEMHVLRKLTLDDVPKEAVQKEKRDIMLSKAEREAQRLEEKAQQVARKKKMLISQEQIKKKEGRVTLPAGGITVKELAEKAGIQVPRIIATLMKNGVMATVNQSIDYETAAIVAGELGVTVIQEEETACVEDLLSGNLDELLRDDPENLTERPPIVVVMGHVDHGKTALLDAIRETDVVSGEAGGITQHIGAYQVVHAGKPITFLDTPGHEAFTAMRARGAKVTDIAVIAVSADEGVKDQTREAIDHAKAAGVPIIVALTKMDLETADPDRVKGELSKEGLQPDDWGGAVPTVPCSAVTKKGITDLLDHILFVAGQQNLKANSARRAIATVIESHRNPSLGSLGTVIVNAGTLRVGESFVCGETWGKVRLMRDSKGESGIDVPPSGAVEVSGFQSIPHAGDILQVVSSEREARTLVRAVSNRRKDQRKRTFVDLVSRLSEGKIHQLNIVLKADTQGSLEAITHALGREGSAEAIVSVIHGGIGPVTESDVLMASASDGVIIAFGVPVAGSVLKVADSEGVEVREYDIIYKVVEDLSDLLKGLLEPEVREEVIGHLTVKAVFLKKKSEQIVGGRVTDGVVKRVYVHIRRPSFAKASPFAPRATGDKTAGDGFAVVGDGRITNVKYVDKDVKEAKEGTECGVLVETDTPIQEGDVLEMFTKEFKKKRKEA